MRSIFKNWNSVQDRYQGPSGQLCSYSYSLGIYIKLGISKSDWAKILNGIP